MIIFNKAEPWPNKVNFVDENNVMLGYDLDQSCCECAGWFIHSSVLPIIPTDENGKKIEYSNLSPINTITDLEDWVFDTGFIATIKDERNLDEGKIVVFRITRDKAERFIHIYNCHNGYYSHGFTFSGHGKVTL